MKSILALIGLGVVLYVVLFVPLGSRTLWEHGRRIAATDEAQELGAEASDAAERLQEHIEEELQEHVLLDGGLAEVPEMPDAPELPALRVTTEVAP